MKNLLEAFVQSGINELFNYCHCGSDIEQIIWNTVLLYDQGQSHFLNKRLDMHDTFHVQLIQQISTIDFSLWEYLRDEVHVP
jgi:hypothetical protein